MERRGQEAQSGPTGRYGPRGARGPATSRILFLSESFGKGSRAHTKTRPGALKRRGTFLLLIFSFSPLEGEGKKGGERAGSWKDRTSGNKQVEGEMRGEAGEGRSQPLVWGAYRGLGKKLKGWRNGGGGRSEAGRARGGSPMRFGRGEGRRKWETGGPVKRGTGEPGRGMKRRGHGDRG